MFKKIWFYYIEVYDEDFNFKTFINRFNSASGSLGNEYNIYYGLCNNCRYYDNDTDEVLSHQGRYITVILYTNKYNPSTLRQVISYRCAGDGCSVILDCQKHEFIWVDYKLPVKYHESFLNNYSEYQTNKTNLEVIQYITGNIKMIISE